MTTMPPVRAFTIFSDVPDGCRLHLEDSTRHAPHIRPGESAVVDTTDREIQFGELYLIDQKRGPMIWQIGAAGAFWGRNRKESDPPLAMLHPLNRPRTWQETEAIMHATPPMGMVPLHMSDGPIAVDYLEPIILGRVIGVFKAADADLKRLVD